MSFTEHKFEKRLLELKDSQESIQSLSGWCLQQKQYHKKIVATWLRIFKRVKVEQRLSLFYLANDVIQYSKRKNYEFVASWGLALQKATPLVRDDKIKHKILRIFKIWAERGVYDETFISDLCGLLSTTTKKKYPEVEFQPSHLIRRIRNCASLEQDTDMKFKTMNEKNVLNFDMDAVLNNAKDRQQLDDAVSEFNAGASYMDAYSLALEREIKERNCLIDILEVAESFYENQNGEARVVWNAYRNFGSRVRTLKRRLDEITPTLKDRSPIPSPDADAPSPSADEDIDIPDNFSAEPVTTVASTTANMMDTAFTSFMNTANLPFDLQKSIFTDGFPSVPPQPSVSSVQVKVETTQSDTSAAEGKPIEVINSRAASEEAKLKDILKTLTTIPLIGPEMSSLSSTAVKDEYTQSSMINTSNYEYSPALIASLLDPPPAPPEPFPAESSVMYKTTESTASYKTADTSSYNEILPSTTYKSADSPVAFGSVNSSACYKDTNLHTPYTPHEQQDPYRTPEHKVSYKTPDISSSERLSPYNPVESSTPYQSTENQNSWKTKLPPKFPTWGDATPNWESEKTSEWMPAMPINRIVPPHVVETPESPPTFEKESYGHPVEYDDSVPMNESLEDVDHRTLVSLPHADESDTFNCDLEENVEDTDHRTFMQLPNLSHAQDKDHRTLPMRKKDVDHRTLPLRKNDVDHRNLISLTGSPLRDSQAPMAPPPTPPSFMWMHGDQDYRSSGIRKLEDKNENKWGTDKDYRQYSTRTNLRKSSEESLDNVESVDMELSDEEGYDSVGSQYAGSDNVHSRKSGNFDRGYNGSYSTKNDAYHNSTNAETNLQESKTNYQTSFQKIPTIGVDIRPIRQRNPQISNATPVRSYMGMAQAPRGFGLSSHSTRTFRPGQTAPTVPMAPPPLPPMLPGEGDKFRPPNSLFRPSFSPRHTAIQGRPIGFFPTRPLILSPLRQTSPLSSGRDLIYTRPLMSQPNTSTATSIEYFHGKPARSNSSHINNSDSFSKHGRFYTRSLSTPHIVDTPASDSLPEKQPVSSIDKSEVTDTESLSIPVLHEENDLPLATSSDAVSKSTPEMQLKDNMLTSPSSENEEDTFPTDEDLYDPSSLPQEGDMLDTELPDTEMPENHEDSVPPSNLSQEMSEKVEDTSDEMYGEDTKYISNNSLEHSDDENHGLLDDSIPDSDHDFNRSVELDDTNDKNCEEVDDSTAVLNDSSLPNDKDDENEIVQECEDETDISIISKEMPAESHLESSPSSNHRSSFISNFRNENALWMNDDIPESGLFPDEESDEESIERNERWLPLKFENENSFEERSDRVRFQFRGNRSRGRGRGQAQPFNKSVRGGFIPRTRPEGFTPRARPESLISRTRPEGFTPRTRTEGFAPRGRPEGFAPRARPEGFAPRTRPDIGWIGPKRGMLASSGPLLGPAPQPAGPFKNTMIPRMQNPHMRFQFHGGSPNAPPPLLNTNSNFMKGNRGQFRPFRGNNPNHFKRW